MSTQQDHRTGILKRAWNDRRARLARWGCMILVCVALFADFLANDKPLYCKLDGAHRFPALRQMFAQLGLASHTIALDATDWKALTYERVVFAPVPYSSRASDLKNANFRSPFDDQQIRSARFRHWLGTDHLGRDVLAGLIHGTRITLLTGLCSMLLAALLGIPLGAIAGYLGDGRLRMRIPQIVILMCGILMSVYAAGIVWTTEAGVARKGWFMLIAVLIVTSVLYYFLGRLTSMKAVRIPVDTLSLRGVEVIRSIPAFFLLFAVLGMIRSPKLHYVILLIAFLWTPTILRFVRAEALRLRDQTFVQSAIVLGLSPLKIIVRHIIPNAIGPAMITIVFGIGTAVLVESGLSFLGIGIAPEVVSWGKMLNLARSNFSAWWMALLPGAAIFFTIAIFNRLGDVLESHMARGGR